MGRQEVPSLQPLLLGFTVCDGKSHVLLLTKSITLEEGTDSQKDELVCLQRAVLSPRQWDV